MSEQNSYNGENSLSPAGGTSMNLFTAAQMKEIDRIAIEERGIPSTLLMERAAKAVVNEVLALPLPGPKKGACSIAFISSSKNGCKPSKDELAQREKEYWVFKQRSAIIYCGPGNNGGDGIAVARFLLREGWQVKCVLVGKREKMTEDSREMERRLIEAGGVLEDFSPGNWSQYAGFDIAIDALFGIGLNSELRADAVEAIKNMKTAQWIVSVDIPSGVHADTGMVFECAVKADVTVTFSAGKPGLYVGKGAVHAGRVVVADIGIPDDLLEPDGNCHAFVADPPVLRRRKRDAHKGDFGKLFILAGSVGYTGAPVLASRAAVRAGAGLVTLAVPQEVYPIVAVKCDEAMVLPWSDRYEDILEKARACDLALIGPGLGQSQRTEEIVLALLRDLTCPVVLDADGLNIVSRHIDVLDKRDGLTILTPHDGEFSRLSGCTLPILNRMDLAMDFAEKHHCVVVLKGHRTITAVWNRVCAINTTGNPGMARGGAGDALAGLMAGLLAQCSVKNPSYLDRVLDAVWLHGRAGDLAAQDKGEYGMNIGDLIEQIPYVMKECEEEA